jgi:hypothetical protein
MKLFRSEIEDVFSRENFGKIEDFVNADNFLKAGFKFFSSELSAKTYPATVRFYHNLKFAPKDILTTSQIGGTVTWDSDSVTDTYVEATITAAVKFRAFMGSYAEGRTS